MTSEEQDIYALMGISPLVLLPDGESKNPKSTIVQVNSVDAHDPENLSVMEEDNLEDREEVTPNLDKDEVAKVEGNWGWMAPSGEQELSSQASEEEENDLMDAEDHDMGEGILETRRRRRRRSSADLD
jgi:ribonuclease E